MVDDSLHARRSSQRTRVMRLFACGLALALTSMFSACSKDSPECPIDDGDPCTLDECKSGVAVNNYLGDGHPCFVGKLQGACSMGTCAIACESTSDCNDGLACTSSTCQQKLCVIEVDDQLVAPDDGNACTEEHCVGGEVVSWPKMDGSSCGTAECTSGTCAHCATPDDCGATTECRTWTCDNGKCVSKYKPAYTSILVGAVKGDCKQKVCDGNGAVIEAGFPSDTPADYEPCFSWLCVGMTPLRVPNIGEKCLMDSGLIGHCNVGGHCVQCMQDVDCVSGFYCHDNECRKCGDAPIVGAEICGSSCGACISAQCDDDNDCASGHCVWTNGGAQKVCCDAACDGVCQECTSAGKCVPVPTGQADTDTCYFPDMACVSTHCRYKVGHDCVSNWDCVTSFCDNATKKCK